MTEINLGGGILLITQVALLVLYYGGVYPILPWLVACFPEKTLHIQSSMGHDADTIVHNYLGMVFTREQNDAIRTKYLNEWGTLV